jgi:hypothetical protein
MRTPDLAPDERRRGAAAARPATGISGVRMAAGAAGHGEEPGVELGDLAVAAARPAAERGPGRTDV